MGQELKTLGELREELSANFIDSFIPFFVKETKNWYAYDPDCALPDDNIFIIRSGAIPGGFVALNRSAKVTANPDDIPSNMTSAPKSGLFWINVASAVQKMWASVPVGEIIGWVRIGGNGAK